MADGPNHSRLDAWFKVYPSDLLGNLRYRRCSDETKAIYFELLCAAHTNTPYGFLPPLPELFALIGRLERPLGAALEELLETRLLVRGTDGAVYVPQLVRDRQKVIAGTKGGAASIGRLERSLGPSGLRAQNSEDTELRDKVPSEPPANKSRAPTKTAGKGGNEYTRLWDRLWNELRLGTAYGWTRQDAVQMATAARLAKDDLGELERRIRALLSSTDPWKAANATPRILVSQWNSLAVEIRPVATNKAMQGIIAMQEYTNRVRNLKYEEEA